MTLHDRCVAYRLSEYGQKWPDSCPYVSPSGRWVYGHWTIGGLFKNATRYPGAYPRTYVERVRSMFPEIRDRHVLHLYAGSLPKAKYTRLDLKPETGAEIIGNIVDLPALLAAHPRRGPFRLVMADPPYAGQARKRYDTAPVESWRVFQAMAAAFQPGTHVVWLDTAVPLYQKEQWLRWGDIAIERSTGHARRGAAFFERRAA